MGMKRAPAVVTGTARAGLVHAGARVAAARGVGPIVAVVLLLAHAPWVGAENHLVAIGLTSHGFAGVRVSYEYLLTPEIRLGGFWRGSALMMIQGDFDTGEAGISLGGLRDMVGPWFVDTQASVGYRYQTQSLGKARSLFGEVSGRIGVKGDGASVAAELGWEQTVLSTLRYSDFVKQTFTGRYDDETSPPEGTRRLSPARRLKAGVASTILLANRTAIDVAAGMLWTPNPFVSGFEGMMFGFFPFYADVGVQVAR